MKITITAPIGTTKAGQVRAYRKSPGDLNLAAAAAAYYAAKNGERMIIVPGNSYGSKVYHIAREAEDLRKYTVMRAEAKVVVVDTDGACAWATAE